MEEEEEDDEDGEAQTKTKPEKATDDEEGGEADKSDRDNDDNLEEEEEEKEEEDDNRIKGAASRRLSERRVSHRLDTCGLPGGGEGGEAVTSGKKQVRLSLPNGPYVSRYPALASPSPLTGSGYFRRRTAVTLSDHKTCALVQSNMKMGLGELM